MNPSQRAMSTGPRTEQAIRKDVKVVERLIAQLDERKRVINTQFERTDDADEAIRLEAELTLVAEQLSDAEDRWTELNGELEAVG